LTVSKVHRQHGAAPTQAAPATRRALQKSALAPSDRGGEDRLEKMVGELRRARAMLTELLNKPSAVAPSGVAPARAMREVPLQSSTGEHEPVRPWHHVTYARAKHAYNAHESRAGAQLECRGPNQRAREIELRGSIQCETGKVDCFASSDLLSTALEVQEVAVLPAECRPAHESHVVARVWRVKWGSVKVEGAVDPQRSVRLVIYPNGSLVADLTPGLDDWCLTFGEGIVAQAGFGTSLRPTDPPVQVPLVPSATLTPSARPLVAVGLPMTSRGLNLRSLKRSPLVQTALPSLKRSLKGDLQKYSVVVYAGYDSGDPFWSSKRWSYKEIEALVGGMIRVKIIECNCSCMVCNTNCIMSQAYNEGAEYFFRSNDDTGISRGTDWISTFASTLAQFDPPNLGVVGPDCGVGNTAILTHDFVHRIHLELFDRAYYPRSFTNWWCDDWISRTYGRQRTVQDMNVAVRHTAEKQRYTVDYTVKKPGGAYDRELANSVALVRAYLAERSKKS